MAQSTPRPRVFRALRLAGGALVVLALTIDWTPLGSPGFDREQILALASGMLLLSIGLLGRRSADLYRVVAFNVLNLLLLLFCLEVGALAMLRARSLGLGSPEGQPDGGSPAGSRAGYYASQDWSAQHWRELEKIMNDNKYRSWLHWDQRPFAGVTVNVDENGVRQTPGARCDADAYRVFTFGGSTMWGWGAPDWGTIAAYLQSNLQELTEKPICVMNFGELGYVSTQSLIQLMLELRAQNVPHLVVFYDGIADVMAAHQIGDAGAHIHEPRAAERQERVCPLIHQQKLLRLSNLYLLLEAWAGEVQPLGYNYQTMGKDVADLADATTKTYLGNYAVVEKLAQGYGFDYLFFWQPAISLGKKPLTAIERDMRSRLSAAFVDLTDAAHERIVRAAAARENLHVIVDVFDQRDDSIWHDSFHVTPVGNQLVAQAMWPGVREKARSFIGGG